MAWSTKVALTGFGATAVAFGPARMGFGLFLPEFRQSFEISSTLAGGIASLGFCAFLAALPVTARLVHHVGPKIPVILGSLSATTGFLLAATAAGPLQLLVGIMFASASAGLCWAPFNVATEHAVSWRARPGVLAIIASGTSIGIMLAAALSLAVTYEQLSWRVAWMGFALAGLIVSAGAMVEMPRNPRREDERPQSGLAGLFGEKSSPLFLAALAFGATNAIYFSFAADRVVEAGGLPGLSSGAAAAIIFLSYGACGLLGIFTGKAESITGIGWLLRTVFGAATVSHLLIALAPQSWAAVVISAGLQGAALMVVSAILSIWSLRLFARNATSGFVAALSSLAVGSVIGPATAGFLSDLAGPQTMFLIVCIPTLLMAVQPTQWVSSKACNPA